MGDFNIDLLRIDDHSDYENFINTLGSFCFQPQIIQPTRITSHSVTLIDIFLPITSAEIEIEISKLKTGKATGPFSIPISVLKILKTVVAKPLEILFNTSFSSGIVPTKPVYKNKSPTSLCNYCPISLLSIFNKLLEKLMYKRLLDFLEKKKVLFKKQFGFRENHSTDHAILSIIHNIQLAIDERDFSCGIFLDFSKAFDTENYGGPEGTPLSTE